MENYEVGRGVESYCTKCKTDTAHVITAIEGQTISKVMCQICYSYHKYKAPAGSNDDSAKVTIKKTKTATGKTSVKATVTTPKPKKTTTKRVRRVSVRKTESWVDLIDRVDKEEAVDYIFSGNYENGSLVNHKKFGLGIVRNVVSEQKIEVVFESGTKTLIQNWEDE